MEHAEALNEETCREHQDLSTADLDITELYAWLDRPVSEDDYDIIDT